MAEIIFGSLLFSAFFLILSVILQKAVGSIFSTLIFFTMIFMGLGTMGLSAQAIYITWANTAPYNSSMAIPQTMMTLQPWSILIVFLFLFMGLIFFILNAYGKLGEKKK